MIKVELVNSLIEQIALKLDTEYKQNHEYCSMDKLDGKPIYRENNITVVSFHTAVFNLRPASIFILDKNTLPSQIVNRALIGYEYAEDTEKIESIMRQLIEDNLKALNIQKEAKTIGELFTFKLPSFPPKFEKYFRDIENTTQIEIRCYSCATEGQTPKLIKALADLKSSEDNNLTLKKDNN